MTLTMIRRSKTTTSTSITTACTTGTNSEHAMMTGLPPKRIDNANGRSKMTKLKSMKVIEQEAAEAQAQVRKNVNEFARKTLREKFQHTTIVDESKYLPHFTLNEVVKGRQLGKGGFGIVYEILDFDIDGVGNNNDNGSSRNKSAVSTKPSKGSTGKNSPSNSKTSKKGLFGFRLKNRSATSSMSAITATSANEHLQPNNNLDVDLNETGPSATSINQENSTTASTTITKVGSSYVQEGRKFMKRHCIRGNLRNVSVKSRSYNSKARYAIKVLRPDVIKDVTKQYFQGIMDLNTETKLLSSLQHPNIVKLRGISYGSPTRFHSNYFIILDRLYDILENKLVVWQKRSIYVNDGKNLIGQLVDRKQIKSQKLWQERLLAAYDLSSALSYLHSKNIIHRDIKPDNIGFDIRGDIKIFDFGLARELPPSERKISNQTNDMYGYEDMDNRRNHDDETWHMTTNTGTPRYMAPEVALEQPYNATCDAYSFCVLLWEMLALRTPFEVYTFKTFETKVWSATVQKRPQVDKSWSKQLHGLFEYGWCHDVQHRTPMSGISRILHQEVISSCHNNGRDDNAAGRIDLEHQRRRSTHVLEISPSQKNMLSKILASPFSSRTKKQPFRLKNGLSSPSPGKKSNSKRSLGGKSNSKRSLGGKTNSKRSLGAKKNSSKRGALDGSQSSFNVSPTSTKRSISNRRLNGGGDDEKVSKAKSIPMLPSKPPLFDSDDDEEVVENTTSKVVANASTPSTAMEDEKAQPKIVEERFENIRDSPKGRKRRIYRDDDSIDDDELFSKPKLTKSPWSEKLNLEKARQQRIRDRIAKIQSGQ